MAEEGGVGGALVEPFEAQAEEQQNHGEIENGGAEEAAVAAEAPSPMETGAPPNAQQGQDGGTNPEGGGGLFQPTLFSYIANDLVWARAGSKGNDPFWPVRSLHERKSSLMIIIKK